MSDAELAWKLVAIAAIVVNLILLVKKLMGKGEARAILNDPLNVREHPEVMTRRECGLLNAQFEARLAVLERRFDTQQHDIKTELSEIHGRITANHSETMRAIGRLEGGQ